MNSFSMNTYYNTMHRQYLTEDLFPNMGHIRAAAMEHAVADELGVEKNGVLFLKIMDKALTIFSKSYRESKKQLTEKFSRFVPQAFADTQLHDYVIKSESDKLYVNTISHLTRHDYVKYQFIEKQDLNAAGATLEYPNLGFPNRLLFLVEVSERKKDEQARDYAYPSDTSERSTGLEQNID